MIRDNRSKLDVYLEKAKSVGRHHVEVGVLEDSSYDNGASLFEVAAIQEFGDGDKIPERSFIREYVDDNEDKIHTMLRRGADFVLNKQMNAETALDRIGDAIVLGMREHIEAGIEPQNSPFTIAKKGSSTPLIDTTKLYASIKAEIK